jgi:hypothetical protein
MRRTSILLILIALLALADGTLAMSAPDYRLDWLTLAGGGGGPAGSSSYAINLTVGQAAMGAAAGMDYQACLGYWCETAGPWRIYLPLVLSG